jgi:hypothetical protein
MLIFEQKNQKWSKCWMSLKSFVKELEEIQKLSSALKLVQSAVINSDLSSRQTKKFRLFAKR